jgi:hypothetical protein
MANLSDLARPASEAPIGSGLARMASNKIGMTNAYRQYVIDTQSEGNEPMSFEEFMKSRNG